MPDEIDGYSVENKSIRIIINADDKGELWIDGKFYQKFRGRSGDGNVIITYDAKLNTPFTIAIKVINEWGAGNLGYVKLITDKAYQLRKAHAEMKVNWDRLDRYINRHPEPDMKVISKVTQAIIENKELSFSKAITFTNSAIKGAEAELLENPAFLIPPYLQNLQEDAITIMWETAYPTYGTVFYGKNGNMDHKSM